MISYIFSFNQAAEIFLAAVAYIIAIMCAIIFHEYAHGYAAYKCGDMTAKFAGRLSLNPRVHFNLVGFLMFVIVGFGFAKPVPINPDNFKKKKRDLILVSLAGVVTNFILAFVAFGILAAIMAIFGKTTFPGMSFGYLTLFFFTQFFLITVLINLCLMIFNLLPIYPLDGFRLVETLTKPNNGFVRFMYSYGAYIFMGVILIGALIPQIDILSMYIGWVQNLVLKLFSAIFGTSIFGF